MSRHTTPSGRLSVGVTSSIMAARKAAPCLPLPKGTATRRPACQKSRGKPTGREYVNSAQGGLINAQEAYSMDIHKKSPLRGRNGLFYTIVFMVYWNWTKFLSKPRSS